jgi:hypothetical protein
METAQAELGVSGGTLTGDTGKVDVRTVSAGRTGERRELRGLAHTDPMGKVNTETDVRERGASGARGVFLPLPLPLNNSLLLVPWA